MKFNKIKKYIPFLIGLLGGLSLLTGVLTVLGGVMILLSLLTLVIRYAIPVVRTSYQWMWWERMSTKVVKSMCLTLIITLVGFFSLTLKIMEVKVLKTQKVGNKYIVYTDKGALECRNSFTFFKFHSQELYGTIRSDDVLEVTVYGVRMKILDVYPNLISSRPMRSKKQE